MTVETTPQQVAEAIGWQLVEVCAGGEFGACIVANTGGATAIMEVRPQGLLDGIRTSAALCERLRALGYPAPAHFGDGEALERAYSLQQLMPGAIPTPIDVTHIEQMAGLTEIQHRAAGVDPDATALAWPGGPAGRLDAWSSSASMTGSPRRWPTGSKRSSSARPASSSRRLTFDTATSTTATCSPSALR